MSGANRTARVSVIDEAVNPLETRFAGGAFTDGASDSYAALNAACQAAAVAPKGRIFIPPYTFRTSQGIVVASDTFVMEGTGAKRSRIMMTSGVNNDVFRLTTAGSAGFSSQGRIVGVTFATSGSTFSNGKAGLVLDTVHKFSIQDCYSFGHDIAFDLRNNCYGTRFIGNAADGSTNRVGLLLRGATPAAPFTAGSGSDITLVDNWFGGSRAGIWMEMNAGGYHILGGQLNGGTSQAAEHDENGSLLLGLSYDVLTTTTATTSPGAATISVADGSTTALFSAGHLLIGDNLVAYTGRTGTSGGGTITGVSGVTSTIPSGTPIYNRGRVSQVELAGVSFEGTSKRHAVRAFDTMDGLSLNECSINSNGSNRIMSVIKGVSANNSVVALRRLAVRGTFTGSIPLDISGLSGSWDIMEEQPNVVDSATFNAVTMNFQTKPMIEWSSLGTRSRAFFGDKFRYGGRTMRWNGTSLESHTDSSASTGWTVISGGGGTASDQLERYTRPGVLTAPEVGIARMDFPFAVTIVSITATVTTAPTDGVGVRIDVNKNGTTIYTTQANRPTIAPATNTATTAPTVTAVAAGEYLTFDVDDAGTTPGAATLTITVRYHA